MICTFPVFMGCDMYTDEPSNNPEAIFENLWTTFNEEYALFDERHVDWEATYAVFRPMVSSNTTDAELFTILSQMLGRLDDGHVNLTAPGKNVFYSNKIRNELIDDTLFDLPVVRSYLEPEYKEGDEHSYIYGKIKNKNIGYIYFDHIGENFFKLKDFLNKYGDVNGYIIDLRHNEGGDFTYSFPEIGRLTDRSRYVFRSRTKNGKGPNDFTDWHKWSIHPNGDYINKPIVVLIDRYTISAGERAVMAFKTLPNVTLIGDTTNGAQGTMIGRELPNGWFYSIVTQKTEVYDGQSYEGIGLAPTIYSINRLSDVNAGIDQTLQMAIDNLDP